MSDTGLEQMFQQGVAAIRAGDKAKARELLTEVVQKDQLHEQAWLWLSAAVTDKDEQILCLQNVLTINPGSELAQRGLRKLGALPPEPEPAAPPPSEPTPEPAPVKNSAPPVDDWRARLKEDSFVSEATIVKPMHEPPKLGIADLANAWVWALIFQVAGPYEEHVEYGPASHILISIVTAILLELLGVGTWFGILSTNPKIRAAFSQGMSSRLPSGASAAATNTITLGLLTFVAIVFVVLVFTTFVSLLFQAIVMNRVAEWLGGKGSVIPLAQALTIALVPSTLIMIPAVIGWTLTSGTASWLFLGAGSLYQFLQVSNAVNASHKLGIFASMGAVIISSFAMGLIGCCLSVGSTFLFGGGR
jgi:hypothetical protein